MDSVDVMMDAIDKALDDGHVSDVLSVLTGMVVGLMLELCRREGHDTNGPVTIDGGDNRDLTIGPPKTKE